MSRLGGDNPPDYNLFGSEIRDYLDPAVSDTISFDGEHAYGDPPNLYFAGYYSAVLDVGEGAFQLHVGG